MISALVFLTFSNVLKLLVVIILLTFCVQQNWGESNVGVVTYTKGILFYRLRNKLPTRNKHHIQY